MSSRSDSDSKPRRWPRRHQGRLPRRCAAAYYPEASGLIAASAWSAQTRTPLYKEMPVRVTAHRGD